MATFQTGSDGFPGVEQITDEAAHLSRGERDELVRRIHHLDDSDLDYDDELDFAEILANKNALA
jgi:hypothetical protein